ncbi:hypothetical protein EJ08DRAFT_691695 [Tothia fuscella]|uniref:Uncharacterized protein n=1 Tax=Tothia fuscella TaxID=1048955 RepID=A0A9P4U367_9PEZI|nr:hypothetical protein EJ08DRAFT_691695 [Tothia fuscella]
MASSSTELPQSHGTKRRPTDELEGEQRLAKRFDLLNLDRNGKLYIPVDKSTTTTQLQTQRPIEDNEFMEVEDSKHKVYIYDLDKELAEAESDEDRPIFIPDIEKHLHKIPKHILIGDDAKAMANMQMVLYTVPASLTVPEEQDSVRRAIAESRQRTRDRQGMGIAPVESSSVPKKEDINSNCFGDGIVNEDSMYDQADDVDAMELD